MDATSSLHYRECPEVYSQAILVRTQSQIYSLLGVDECCLKGDQGTGDVKYCVLQNLRLTWSFLRPCEPPQLLHFPPTASLGRSLAVIPLHARDTWSVSANVKQPIVDRRVGRNEWVPVSPSHFVPLRRLSFLCPTSRKRSGMDRILDSAECSRETCYELCFTHPSSSLHVLANALHLS